MLVENNHGAGQQSFNFPTYTLMVRVAQWYLTGLSMRTGLLI
ncbi:hypothetical protein Pla110_03030 [Polystyrenella longa]|uniref:Uncharacterized protein n=1 Tax=Polystyrenella longa TaxID=2528007 RepID=A0A518CH89_9PLAN|nr:hypothetical protein [Polystyrenella longa]QDU78599.1 hypothetical protein Pla110_03030 [Polystyrenella longa]